MVLGHALYRKASHGGKAKNDTIDAHKIAVRLRGGMLPQASGEPVALRATRDLVRRRMHLMRQRADLLTYIQNTTSQYNLPEIGKKIAYPAHRDGVAERFADPAVQNSLAVDLALIGPSDCPLTALARDLVKTATAHDGQTFDRLRSLPGLGTILALVLRYESHDSRRFPRVQEFVSSCRLLKCANEAAGKRYGTSGKQIGQAYRKGACSEAAVLFLRNNPAGQK